MGMFNTIVADLPCQETGKISENTEIQIKWQASEARVLDVYRTGASLPNLLSEYNNTWVRTDYICSVCSPKTTGHNRRLYIRTDDQRRHIAFVEIRNGKVCCILSESEFQQKGINDFIDDAWPPMESTEQSDPGDPKSLCD
jgi:hypothetical protein